jgi:hypothetical protein
VVFKLVEAAQKSWRRLDGVLIATEGAPWGSVKAHGLLPNTVIVSDDAGQFDVGAHGLCWVHAKRLVHKLDTFTDEHRAAQTAVRTQIWDFYADLKAYRDAPTPASRTALQTRLDGIFTQKTGFITLDRLLKRLHANKPELLMVLERPEIPLHTNGSENDIRCHVPAAAHGRQLDKASRPRAMYRNGLTVPTTLHQCARWI